MPELPEVELRKKYLESTSFNQNIKRVTVKDNKILETISASELERMLYSKKFVSCQRYGKYLFTNVSQKFWLVIHFGMTGDLKYFKSIGDDPLYDRLLVDFDNGFHLAFECQRKFGRVSIATGVEDFVEKKGLGKDALKLSFFDFKRIAKKRKGSVKNVLMNQHVIAGIGNLYSDEILFKTRIHPKTKINKLSSQEIEELFHNMKHVLKVGIRSQIEHSNFPKDFFLPYRVKEAKCPRCGGSIQTQKFSGRTAYFCGSCQTQP